MQYRRLANAWRGWGNALASLEKYNESLQAFNRALELYPMHADAGIACAQKGRGDSLTKLGKPQEALEFGENCAHPLHHLYDYY